MIQTVRSEYSPRTHLFGLSWTSTSSSCAVFLRTFHNVSITLAHFLERALSHWTPGARFHGRLQLRGPGQLRGPSLQLGPGFVTWEMVKYPLISITMERSSIFYWEIHTLSMAIFNSELLKYQSEAMEVASWFGSGFFRTVYMDVLN